MFNLMKLVPFKCVFVTVICAVNKVIVYGILKHSC